MTVAFLIISSSDYLSEAGLASCAGATEALV